MGGECLLLEGFDCLGGGGGRCGRLLGLAALLPLLLSSPFLLFSEGTSIADSPMKAGE